MSSSKDSEKCCRTCAWLSDEFTSVCCNGDSEYRADFVNFDHVCGEWEHRK